MRNGEQLLCRVQSLQNGSVMVRFHQIDLPLAPPEQERFAVLKDS
jgi:hypothetical protein